MPNGVICGGAVEGSNQLGAIVTCQAMVAWPAGACAAALGVAPKTTTATSSDRVTGRRQGRIQSGAMTPSRASGPASGPEDGARARRRQVRLAGVLERPTFPPRRIAGRTRGRNVGGRHRALRRGARAMRLVDLSMTVEECESAPFAKDEYYFKITP